MSAQSIGEGLVALCREAKFAEAVEAYYGSEIVSTEPEGEPREVRGLEAVRGKQAWFGETFETAGVSVNGPWVNEPFFLVQFAIDVVDRKTGERQTMDEFALYEVQGGRIVSERFF